MNPKRSDKTQLGLKAEGIIKLPHKHKVFFDAISNCWPNIPGHPPVIIVQQPIWREAPRMTLE